MINNYPTIIITLLLSLPTLMLLLTSVLPSHQAFADSFTGAIRQRIGNYDIQTKTDPSILIVGDHNTKVLLKISSIRGDELIETPIVIKISKGGTELTRTNPISVMNGHYSYHYIFSEAGIYTLDISIYDVLYNNENITFTFPINVHPAFYKSFSLFAQSTTSLSRTEPGVIFAIVIAVVASGVTAILLVNRRRTKRKSQMEKKSK